MNLGMIRLVKKPMAILVKKNDIFKRLLNRAKDRSLTALNENNFDKFACTVQTALNQEIIDFDQANEIIYSINLPPDCKASLFGRQDHRKTPVAFLQHMADRTNIQKVIAEFVFLSASRFFDVSYKDNGADNSGKWILNKKKLSSSVDYLFFFNSKQFKIEIKDIAAWMSFNAKVDDLIAAVKQNAYSVYYWNGEKRPRDINEFPIGGSIGILSPENAKLILKLTAKPNYRLYGGKLAIELTREDGKYNIFNYMNIYSVNSPEDLPREAFSFVEG